MEFNPPHQFGQAAVVAIALVLSTLMLGPDEGSASDLTWRGRSVIQLTYDGVEDDLATGGLGAAGIQSAEPPGYVDPTAPTLTELRRNAIYVNYRALVDVAPGGGYGVFYGPGVPLEPSGSVPSELIPGDEFLVLSGRGNTTLMVQVPESFDPSAACIVTGPSSGSRGVYGAIGTSGEWGLKKGCAVAYTDKGTGTGAHDLDRDTVGLIRGDRAPASEASSASTFTARISEATQAAFNAETPNRFAFKHAHSQRNAEANWGQSVLDAIDFAFFVLNKTILPQRYPDAAPLRPDNTLVIASSVSNGGGASLLAAEQAEPGVIDGVAVSEPNVNPHFEPSFVIRQGDGDPLVEHSRPLYDYTTLLNVFQGCANLANPDAPLNLVAPELGEARCTSLGEKDLLESGTPAEQAAEAQAILNDYGLVPEQNVVQPSHWFLRISQGVSVTYANAYGRFPVHDRLCGYGFGATDETGEPVMLADTAEAILFATSNGIPPTGGINLINEASPGGPLENRVSVSPSTRRADQNLDGALCLRTLATGSRPEAERVAEGIEQILASGDLGGKPVVIVTGRADAILPINHTSRGYYGLNQTVEGAASGLRYIEILNAQHLDALNGLAGFNNRFVPLHHYLFQGLNILYAHLNEGAPLPPSQVVRTIPRATLDDGTVAALSEANLPSIMFAPDESDLITFGDGVLFIPD